MSEDDNNVFITGNRAAAEAVRLSRVQVIPAYPITPQTHLVEYLSEYVNNGELDADFIRVESEHSAMSAAVGASSVGARTFTATSSQGLQLMSECLYFASGMRMPIVMCIAHRSLAIPISIWTDQQDTLVNRDAGWLQAYAATPQEIFDWTIMMYKICENGDVSLPGIVAYDGFIVSHVADQVDKLTQEQVDGFLNPLGKVERPILELGNPIQMGVIVMADYYHDYEYKKHIALRDSINVIKKVTKEFGERFGRKYDVVESYMTDDAEIIFISMGSHTLTAKWVVNKLRDQGEKVGLINLRVFRPFPMDDLIEACRNAKVIAVLDRSIGYGTTGLVYPDVTRALYNLPQRPNSLDFIMGLGGKDITAETIFSCFEQAKKAFESNDFSNDIVWLDVRTDEAEEVN
jgi:pyruvate ferredoxin oxidoreductase alpha subunit